MSRAEKAEEVQRLLVDLLALLNSQHETNWRRGIVAAVAELTDKDGKVNLAGFENARSIYKTMIAGGRGFSEYFVWSDDEEQRIRANRDLDDLRGKLAASFDSA